MDCQANTYHTHDKLRGATAASDCLPILRLICCECFLQSSSHFPPLLPLSGYCLACVLPRLLLLLVPLQGNVIDKVPAYLMQQYQIPKKYFLVKK